MWFHCCKNKIKLCIDLYCTIRVRGIAGNPNLLGIDSRLKGFPAEGIVVVDGMAAQDGSSSTTKRNSKI